MHGHDQDLHWFWAWLVQITIPKDALHRKNPKGEVWQNLILVSALDENQAVAKALQLGQADQGDSKGTLTLDGKPAVTKFVGIEDMVWSTTAWSMGPRFSSDAVAPPWAP